MERKPAKKSEEVSISEVGENQGSVTSRREEHEGWRASTELGNTGAIADPDEISCSGTVGQQPD